MKTPGYFLKNLEVITKVCPKILEQPGYFILKISTNRDSFIKRLKK